MKLDGELSVDVLADVVAFGDDLVFVPLGDVDGDRVALGYDPTITCRISYDTLAILYDNTPTALVVDHGVVLGLGVHIALVATDGPISNIGHFFASVLNTGIVSGGAHLGFEFKVLELAAAPDEELIVVEMVGTFGATCDGPVFDRPEFGIAVPAGQVPAVKKGLVFLGVERKAQANGEKAGDEFSHGRYR